MIQLLTSAVVLLVLTIATTASAASITYTFTGTVFDDGGPLIIPVGTGMTGSITVDLAAPDLNSDPERAVYIAISLDVTIGAFSLHSSDPSIHIADGPPGTGFVDQFIISAPPDAFGGEFSAGVQDFSDGSLIATTALPLSDINVASFPSAFFNFHVRDIDGTRISAAGRLETLSVPEPSSIALLISGLAAAIFARGSARTNLVCRLRQRRCRWL